MLRIFVVVRRKHLKRSCCYIVFIEYYKCLPVVWNHLHPDSLHLLRFQAREKNFPLSSAAMHKQVWNNPKKQQDAKASYLCDLQTRIRLILHHASIVLRWDSDKMSPICLRNLIAKKAQSLQPTHKIQIIVILNYLLTYRHYSQNRVIYSHHCRKVLVWFVVCRP